MCALAECTWYCEGLGFCLFNISELKDSIFHELIFVYYIAIFVRALDFFASFSCLVAKFIRSWCRKNVLSLVKHIHGVHENTLLVFYLFLWESCEWKKQYYIFNIFSMFQMLGKDHELFLKFFLGSVSLVHVIPNLALRFFNFLAIAITRLFNVITCNNNVAV